MRKITDEFLRRLPSLGGAAQADEGMQAKRLSLLAKSACGMEPLMCCDGGQGVDVIAACIGMPSAFEKLQLVGDARVFLLLAGTRGGRRDLRNAALLAEVGRLGEVRRGCLRFHRQLRKRLLLRSLGWNDCGGT